MSRVTFEKAVLTSPIGPLALYVLDGALVGVSFSDYAHAVESWIEREHRASGAREVRDPAGWGTRFARYLDGDMGAFEGGPLATGGSPFQRDVWTALLAIPAGTTVSYGELARRLGRADLSRAVGAANGANPIPVVIPCHRVVAADGSLHGYGGGLDRKRWLLAHEAAHAGAQRSFGFST